MAATGPRVSRRADLEMVLGLRYLEAGRPPEGALISLKEILGVMDPGTPRNTVSSAMERLARRGLVKSAKDTHGRGWYWVMHDFGQDPSRPPGAVPGGRATSSAVEKGLSKVAVIKFMRDNPGPHDFREVGRATGVKDPHHWFKDLAAEGVLRRVAEGVYEWKGVRAAQPVPAALPPRDLPLYPEAAQHRLAALQEGLKASLSNGLPATEMAVPLPPQVQLPNQAEGVMLVSKELAPGKRLLQDPDDNTFWLATQLG